ncbi:vanadium-dependent haloperoxidase [Chitinophaga sp. Hz27]|uniref:vanadium-dependent haloperoxidase n=1 Tax=Chitinophaga sp. Hz27 TaxID=3347169 RepID=UPI0035E24DC7
MKPIRLFSRFLGIVLLLGLASCSKQDTRLQSASDKAAIVVESFGNSATAVPVSWYQLELKLIKETPGFTPPIAARAIAYTGITLHEAVLGNSRYAVSLVGQLNGLQSVPPYNRQQTYSWPVVANSAMAQIIRSLFPNASAANQQLIAQLESTNQQAYTDSCSTTIITRSVAYGKQVADSIYQWSASDGGKDGYLNNFPSSYIPPVGPGLWVPTPPQFQSAMLPYWGNNRTLLKPAASDSVILLPPTFATDTTSAFYQAAHLVYQKRLTLTPEETTIALYWADGGGTFTPPGHLIAIAAQLAADQHLGLSQAAALFAQTGISLNDAGILCWKYKYHYNTIRPVTYINRYIDSSWTPLIATPPFPSFTSGHATFTGAAGTVLAGVFGNSFSFTDRQKVPEGFAPRSFSSFNAMIDEAAISRIYGGIHYEFDSEAGKATGKQLAARVLSLRY